MHDTESGIAIENELTVITVSTSEDEAFFVVGIGASAGGLEALEQFVEHVPEKSRLCFVVVQHLSPDFKSMMDELLARRTRIRIVRVEDGIELRPNAIYLMPPRKEMIQSTGRLYLTDKDLSQGFALPIDRYLRSLAQDFGSRSIGVILSGTGSDGSRGIRDIHDACGLVLAQSEESSRFDGMPRSARETGLVDLVLPPSEMPDAILKLVRMRRSPEEGGEAEPVVPKVGLQAIFRMLRKEYGIDFSHYKPSTVTRRVERRLLLNNSMSVKQYVELLSDHGAELNQLYKDLLIGVTQFFRDREAFHLLASEELPRLLEAVGDDQEFRVWVACCATGEEAYSIAILIQEQLALMNRPILVRIFATDAHRALLEVASTGVYSEASLAAVNPARRAQFFVPKGDGYQVAPHIRKMIVFAPHDLLKDTPFTRLHLVTCRNMLIYLQPPAQKKVLSLFHFGLKAGCVLFLGPSETTGELSDEFESIDDRWKIFRKRRDVRLRTDFRLMSTAGPQRPRITSPYGATSSASDRLQQAVYDRLLEEHMPPSFLINDRKELVHSFGKAGKYLRVNDGRASTLFLDLIDNDLQSTNEELHSVNEELYTVNAEYQHKIEELTQVTADLENLFLATDVGIVFLDRNLCIRRFTPRAARLLNLLPHDSGRPLSSFAHSLDEPLMELLNHVLETGRPIEKEVRDREGNCYFLRILPYRTSTMTMDGVVLSLIDISPLKVGEAKLQHLSAIVRFSGDAIIGKDLEGRIISWNRGAEEMFGYSAEESIGRDTEFLYPAESSESFEELMAAIRSSRSVTQERRRRRSDGSIIDVLHTVSPICDAAGRIVGVSTISRDITVRKKSEQAIQDTIRNRDHFLAMLSHELRNPPSAILYAAQMLDLRKSVEGNDTEASDVIRRQAEQMRLLLDDLLDVARVTQNKIVLRREVVSLGDIVAEELRTIARLPETSRRVIEVEGMDQVCLVDGDPARLHQVVINLLRNAVKYSSDGGTITVKLSRQDNQAVLSVRDTGVGIAPDMLDQIFELFVQSRDTIDRAEGGLGVGLTLVRAIVELHGGAIRAFSQGTGCGSEFMIQLPLAAPQLVSGALEVKKTDASPPVQVPSLRIVIIEDNSDVQLCLRTLLEMEGNEVRVACDGIAGTDLILDWRPDVAIVDIGLPGRDGFGVAREVHRVISAEVNKLQSHLIALTGYGLPSDKVKVLEAGFDRHLVKPVNLDELLDVLRRIACGVSISP